VSLGSISIRGGALWAFGSFAVFVAIYGYCESSNPNSKFPIQLSSPLSAELVETCRDDERRINFREDAIKYWPNGTFGEATDSFESRWYSTQLCAMEEEPLKRLPYGQTTIRLLIDTSFDEDLVIRIERDVAEVRLIVKTWSKPLPVTDSRELTVKRGEITERQWTAIAVLLEQAPIWNIATNNDRIGGKDGSTWVFEIATAERYHVISRWQGRQLPMVVHLILSLAGDPFP